MHLNVIGQSISFYRCKMRYTNFLGQARVSVLKGLVSRSYSHLTCLPRASEITRDYNKDAIIYDTGDRIILHVSLILIL